MIFLGPSSMGALVLVECPACKERQARARGPQDQKYECRKCAHVFTLAEGFVSALDSEKPKDPTP